MKKILTVVGARPQFIKAAVFSRYLASRQDTLGLKEILVHTGQHYDDNMSQIFFDEMGIPKPVMNLNIGSGTHGASTGMMLVGIDELLEIHKPDFVLVYGDTNSTLAGALAASKRLIPVIHVEAGLRSHMMVMPEEQNRRLTDHLSTWLFCPTSVSVDNLATEGIVASGKKPSIDNKSVHLVGDIMYEAALYYMASLKENQGALPLDLGEDFVLLTVHRAESTDNIDALKGIVDAVNKLQDKRFVFPVHPRTRKILQTTDLSFGTHVRLLDPVGYLDMLRLESKASLVLTDSGGVQKEAFFAGKPCITLRDKTEWVELVESGWNILAGTETNSIIDAVSSFKLPSDKPSLYGDGKTAEKIAAIIAL